MSENTTKPKELHLVSGEGSVILELNEEGLKLSIFDQRMVSEQLDFDERNKIAKWLVDNIIQ